MLIPIIEAEVRLGEKSALGRDILIPSKILRNRAVHGDIVAVEVVFLNIKVTSYINILLVVGQEIMESTFANVTKWCRGRKFFGG